MHTLPMMEQEVTLKQAYLTMFLTMFVYLEQRWSRLGKPDELGALLGELALWNNSSGNTASMDGAVFTDWLEAASTVLHVENQSGFGGANTHLRTDRGDSASEHES